MTDAIIGGILKAVQVVAFLLMAAVFIGWGIAAVRRGDDTRAGLYFMGAVVSFLVAHGEVDND